MSGQPWMSGDVYFGSPETPPANWREDVEPSDADDDAEPSEDDLEAVRGVLGFDPRELEDDGQVRNKPTPPSIKSLGLTKSVQSAIAVYRRLHDEINRAYQAAVGSSRGFAFDKNRLTEFDREVDALPTSELRQLGEQVGVYSGVTKQKVKQKLRTFLEGLQNLAV